jgi:hypothetical protein
LDTAQFYRSIFPGQGQRVLAVFKNGLKQPPLHQFYETDEDLIEAAETYDGLGKNVYHACATYKTSANRKGENVEAVKSLWVDMDVGPTKPYAGQREAAAAIETFRVALGLPTPSLVASGGGIHAYFPFDKPITPEQWKRAAAMLARCLDHYGVKHDTSRTEDVASILRVPGTRNYKTDPARDVRLLRLGEAAPVSQIFARLKEYADAHDVLVLEPSKPKAGPSLNADLIAPKDYPPSEGPLIAEKCGVIQQVHESGGDCSYDIWWRALGVAKHTTEPEPVAIHWTRNRESTGHDKADWAKEMANWNAGPTKCAEFAKHSLACSSCSFNGKITSPIQLGVPELPPIDLTPRADPEPILTWGFKEQWLLDRINQELGVGITDGAMTYGKRDANGVTEHKVINRRYWQVINRVRTPDGIWQLEIGYERYGKMQTFLLDSSSVSAPDKLKATFSAYECHIESSTLGLVVTQDILKWEQRMFHDYKLEVATYPTLGWATETGTPTSPITGEFIIGNEKLAPKQLPSEVLLSDRVDPKFVVDFRTSGTTEEWIALIDRVYNRPGAEAYQFVIASMFAAPLVRLAGGGGEWHGIPIGLTGDSGAAKTTTALVAMSLYGPPSLLRFNGNSSKEGGQGDTPAALAIKMGSLNNLPFVIDEVTSVESERLAAVMFMLSAGRQKDRAESSGKKLVENNHRWDTISLITGNDGLHERLRELRRQNTQDATMLRCFEVPVFRSELDRVFKDVHRTVVDDDLLKEQYGCAGRKWLQFVVDNRAEITATLTAQRKKFEISADDMSDIRFYKDLLITVQVAAVYAKREGFLDFDLKAMMGWARKRLIDLRDHVHQRDWEGTISDFVASLHGRTIVTSRMATGRGRRAGNPEMPRDVLHAGKTPVARKATDDKVFLVTANAVKEWCRENRVGYGQFLQEMAARGYLKITPGVPIEEPRLVNLGSGTTVTRPQAPCFEMDYNMVSVHQDGDDGDIEGIDNVISIADHQPVTPTVTLTLQPDGASLSGSTPPLVTAP